MKDLIRHLATKLFRAIKFTTGYVPPEKVFRHLHFVGPFDVPLPNGRTVVLYSWGNRVENELAWRGWDGHESRERRCWAAMLEDGGDVLDVGANTATYAITAKGLSPSSRVFAFEPVMRIAEKARENVATSGLEITVVCSALARTRGELPIYDPGGENVYSASLDAEFLPGNKDSYLVPVESLDEFCEENDVDPVAVKIDVEGYEGEVICGAVKTLRRGRCKILCEWGGTTESHTEAQEVLRNSSYVALDVRDLREVDLFSRRGFEERNVILLNRREIQDFRNSLAMHS